jgi:phosphoketolase
MEAIDNQFIALIESNPQLRVRVGNPDELRSNRMGNTLDKLKHRVIQSEDGLAESIHGAVITALNEEAVVSAALANKGGINIVISYEAFAVKMLGAIRQEIIFSRHQQELNRAAKWLSVPIIATSHVWENGKNEQSHQDPLFGEALLGEMSDVARVIYPADSNHAVACLNACYQTQGQIWAITIAKQAVKTVFNEQQVGLLIDQGAITLDKDAYIEEQLCNGRLVEVQLVAVGAYQLSLCIEVQKILLNNDIVSCVTYLMEPGRFRLPRDRSEQKFVATNDIRETLFPSDIKLRVFVGHLRPETLLGVCRTLDLGPERSIAFGYINQGGTLDTDGMLLANGSDVETITAKVKQLIYKMVAA